MEANHTSEKDIIGYTVRQAERLEEIDSIDEIHILDVEYNVTSSGDVTGVELLLTCGGPDIRVEALSGTVHGSWGGSTHRTHFDSAVVEDYARTLARQFEERIDG